MYGYLPNDDFMSRWHDENGPTNERIIQLGLIMTGVTTDNKMDYYATYIQ